MAITPKPVDPIFITFGQRRGSLRIVRQIMTTSVADIAPASHPRWHDLLSGRIHATYRCLALRILMIRLVDAYQRSVANRMAVIEELRAFFRDNLRFAGDDYRAIFEGGK